MLVIFGLQSVMRERPAFELKIPLILWNASLAVFSIIAGFRALTFTLGDFYHMDFVDAICYV